MNPATVKIRFYTILLSVMLLGVDIALLYFVLFNLAHLPMYKTEASVQNAHVAAVVTTVVTCLTCFGQCYVACFERTHSKKHRKALVCGTISTMVLIANAVCYIVMITGEYKYKIPTENVTVFDPDDMKENWFNEISDYANHFEEKRNSTHTRETAFKYLRTIDYFQDIAHCCGVLSYKDYSTLSVPIPKSCECSHKTRGLSSCTHGEVVKKQSSMRSGGGMTDIRQLMEARLHVNDTPREHTGNVRWDSVRGRINSDYVDASDVRARTDSDKPDARVQTSHALKVDVFASGCRKKLDSHVHVLSHMLRLLVSSNSLQFLSIIMIPIPWLYETA